MHRQTILAYDLGAEHWAESRYKNPDGVKSVTAAARDFRRRVGQGVILDVGCGPGRLLEALGRPAVGLDASMAMLRIGRDEGAGPFLAADAESMAVETCSAAGCSGPRPSRAWLSPASIRRCALGPTPSSMAA